MSGSVKSDFLHDARAVIHDLAPSKSPGCLSRLPERLTAMLLSPVRYTIFAEPQSWKLLRRV
jgi:hypothetical protein